jgi:hypothetical protein
MEAALPALRLHLRRLESMADLSRPHDAAIDQALAHTLRTCWRLGDERAAIGLENLAKSSDPTTRAIASEALATR